MSLAIIHSRASVGLDAPLVSVEVHISGGLPAFNIVGLPEKSVKESKERVRAALLTTGFEFPNGRITVNLAPADLPKEGGRFDLPIALGILQTLNIIDQKSTQNKEFIGELALDGSLRPVRACISATLETVKNNKILYLPKQNASLAVQVDKAKLIGCTHLLDIVSNLRGQNEIELEKISKLKTREVNYNLDMSDIVGQDHAKKALEITACGGHNLLMQGPPGTGKTMLASRLPTILPNLTAKQAIDVASVYSICGKDRSMDEWLHIPFRSPHHSSSMVSLVGGGSTPRPGEISLAHNGVLFLDELAEFPRVVLDALRQPLESNEIHISRASQQVIFPAKFQLIGAMNPSPCGYFSSNHSRSNHDQTLKYLSKLSGPFLDRFDLSVEVGSLPVGSLSADFKPSESSAIIKQRVIKAREIQYNRAGKLNSELSGRELHKYAKLKQEDSIFLEQAITKLGLSIRAFHRIWRVARSIADLYQSSIITRDHLFEALSYRAIDKLMFTLQK